MITETEKRILRQEFSLKMEIIKQLLFLQRLTNFNNELLKEMEEISSNGEAEAKSSLKKFLIKVSSGTKEKETESLAQKKSKKEKIELALISSEQKLRTAQKELKTLGAEINQD